MEKQKKYLGLCTRCEHRAQFLEMGSRLRHECGQPEFTSNGCYAYTPVTPVGLKRLENDDRPLGAGYLLSARASRGSLPEIDRWGLMINDEYVTVCVPSKYALIKKSNIWYNIYYFINHVPYWVVLGLRKLRWYLFLKWYYLLVNDEE